MKRSVFVVLCVFFIAFTQAAEVSVIPSSGTIDEGGSVSFEVEVNASVETSDLYAVQFSFVYDPLILEFNSIAEGGFLSSDGEEVVYGYGAISNGVINDVYMARNSTIGLYGEGVLATITFTSLTSGDTEVNLTGVIWVNSNITNDSVESVAPFITNASLIIREVEVDEPPVVPGGGGGGGSGGGTSNTVNEAIGNETLDGNSSGEVTFDIDNPSGGETSVDETLGSNESSGGFLSLTGRIVDNVFGEGRVFKSWVFYFILGIGIVFGVVFFIRKYKKKKPYWRPRI